MAQKPPMPMGTMVASAPPAKMTCASPILMVRQASPRAWLEVAQAEQVAKLGPRSLWYIENRPEAMFEMSIGIMKADSRSGPRSSRTCALLGDGLQPADARADEHADFIPVDLVQVQAGIAQGLPAGMHAELREAVRAPDFLGDGQRGRRVEVLDLGGDLASRTATGSKRVILVDAALAGEQVAPRRHRPGDPMG